MSAVAAFFRPGTLADAIRFKREHPASAYVAGGTDLMVKLRAGAASPSALVCLTRVTGFAGVTVAPDGIRIGAGTTVAQIEADERLVSAFPILAQAASSLGSRQVRSRATIGGNLVNASPCADLAPPLLVLDAALEIAGGDGARTLPLGDFFLAPGRTRLRDDEIVAAVLVPPPRVGARGVFLKQGRVAMDLSLASVAATLEVVGGRIVRVRLAAGSVAPRPFRLTRAEAVLTDAEPSAELFRQAGAAAASEVSPITDVRASESHRRHLVGVLVRRALAGLAGLS